MPEPTNLTEQRWSRGSTDPNDYTPIEALEVVLHRLRTGEIKAEHVVICLAEPSEKGIRPYYYQAGKFGGYAQAGLVAAIQRQLLADD